MEMISLAQELKREFLSGQRDYSGTLGGWNKGSCRLFYYGQK